MKAQLSSLKNMAQQRIDAAGQAWLALAVAITAAVPELAHAGAPTAKATAMVNGYVAVGAAIGIGVFTAALYKAAYKMSHEGASIRDVSGIFFGGILAGAAVPTATWIFTA